jgi:hypothetical protein
MLESADLPMERIIRYISEKVGACYRTITNQLESLRVTAKEDDDQDQDSDIDSLGVEAISEAKIERGTMIYSSNSIATTITLTSTSVSSTRVCI